MLLRIPHIDIIREAAVFLAERAGERSKESEKRVEWQKGNGREKKKVPEEEKKEKRKTYLPSRFCPFSRGFSQMLKFPFLTQNRWRPLLFKKCF